MQIYERIKDLRKLLGKTQEDFAKNINISRSNLGNIEINRIGITDRVIRDICVVFNVNEKWLRDGIGEPFSEIKKSFWEDFFAEIEVSCKLDEIDKEIVKTYFELPITYRKIFRKYLKAIVDTEKKEYLSDLKDAPSTPLEQNDEEEPLDTIRLLRAASSEDNKPPEIVDMPKSEIEELRNAPKVTSMDDV